MKKPVFYTGDRPVRGGTYKTVFSTSPITDVGVLNKRGLCECSDLEVISELVTALDDCRLALEILEYPVKESVYVALQAAKEAGL